MFEDGRIYSLDFGETPTLLELIVPIFLFFLSLLAFVIGMAG